MKLGTRALLLVLLASPVAAQPPQTATPGVLVAPPIAVAMQPEPTVFRNVRFEIVITDAGGPKPTTKKVSLIVATGRMGQVRSVAAEPSGTTTTSTRGVPLNVDVINPRVLESGGILSSITIEYQPTSPGTVAVPAVVKASLNAVLASGRKTTISETADPTSDRTTTIEVTATLLQ